MGRNAPELYVDWMVGSLCGATIRASLCDANNMENLGEKIQRKTWKNTHQKTVARRQNHFFLLFMAKN